MEQTNMVTQGGNHHVSLVLTGRDAVIGALLPRPWRLRWLARTLIKHWNLTRQPAPGEFTFSLPSEELIYEITGPNGGVRPYKVTPLTGTR